MPAGDFPPRRLARAKLRAALFLALIGLAGCVGPRPAVPAAGGPLFAAALDDIERLYLDPVPTRRIVMAGMAPLTKLDGKLAVAGMAGSVVVDYGGYDIVRYPMPPDTDANAWGALVAQVIRTAIELSPRLAEMPPERVERVVLRGFTDPLDRFSRYLPPEAARLRLSRESNGMPSVALSLAGNIAVVRIASFNHGTAGRVAADLKAAERGSGAPLAGIVLDLRGNPGGVLQEGVKTAELLISSGPIVRVVGRNPASDQAFVAPGDSITPRVPVAVLIDGGSASASEIVAAAVQDRGRGVVIGTSSFGKGTVQTVQRLPNGGELILTWAWLVMPSGYVLQHHGVVPTWCTEDPRSSATASQRPRAALDEGGWAALRRSCPPRREQGAADLALAERLLSDERLYQAALDALPAPARLTASAGSPAAP